MSDEQMAPETSTVEPTKLRRLTKDDAETLALCIAGAWLHGTISRGRAQEVAEAMGWDFEKIEDLKWREECAEGLPA